MIYVAAVAALIRQQAARKVYCKLCGCNQPCACPHQCQTAEEE